MNCAVLVIRIHGFDFLDIADGQDNRGHDTDKGSVNRNRVVGSAQTGTDSAAVMGSG